jgi:hypothetical protein
MSENDRSVDSTERMHGVCGNCKERFDLRVPHVAYGGILWCTEDCLAEYVVGTDIPADAVAEKLEHRGEAV